MNCTAINRKTVSSVIVGTVMTTFLVANASAQAAPTGSSAKADAASQEMHQSMSKGMDKMMSMKPTGDADRDFASMMKMHHQMAIEMSQTEASNGHSQDMKELAQQIVSDSQRDIQKIDRWLANQKR